MFCQPVSDSSRSPPLLLDAVFVAAIGVVVQRCICCISGTVGDKRTGASLQHHAEDAVAVGIALVSGVDVYQFVACSRTVRIGVCFHVSAAQPSVSTVKVGHEDAKRKVVTCRTHVELVRVTHVVLGHCLLWQ